MHIYVRQMDMDDIAAVKDLIETVLMHKSMSKVYEPSETATWLSCYDEETLAEIVRKCHTCLLFDSDTGKLVASGYIRQCEDHKSVHIGMIFSDPNCRYMGLGRKIVELLENDPYAKSAEKIELLSSMGAYRFYRGLGYENKDGEYQIEKELDTYGVPMVKYLKSIE